MSFPFNLIIFITLLIEGAICFYIGARHGYQKGCDDTLDPETARQLQEKFAELDAKLKAYALRFHNRTQEIEKNAVERFLKEIEVDREAKQE